MTTFIVKVRNNAGGAEDLRSTILDGWGFPYEYEKDPTLLVVEELPDNLEMIDRARRIGSTDTTRKIDTLRRWSQKPVVNEPKYLSDIADEMERIYALMVKRHDEMPWRPIEELTIEARHGNEAGFLIMAPELEDDDCNVHGVGMGYWQDDPDHPSGEGGSWLACKWSMQNDEWYEKQCAPTHYVRLRRTEK